jgi:chromate transport protein ChrA
MKSPVKHGAGAAARNAWQIFLIFLRLGLTSFGGPVAHLGYFREEFVNRRNWLGDRAYADLVALCQFSARPGEQPGRHRARAVAWRLRRRAGGLGGLHAAVSDCPDRVRAGAFDLGRRTSGGSAR